MSNSENFMKLNDARNFVIGRTQKSEAKFDGWASLDLEDERTMLGVNEVAVKGISAVLSFEEMVFERKLIPLWLRFRSDSKLGRMQLKGELPYSPLIQSFDETDEQKVLRVIREQISRSATINESWRNLDTSDEETFKMLLNLAKDPAELRKLEETGFLSGQTFGNIKFRNNHGVNLRTAAPPGVQNIPQGFNSNGGNVPSSSNSAYNMSQANPAMTRAHNGGVSGFFPQTMVSANVPPGMMPQPPPNNTFMTSGYSMQPLHMIPPGFQETNFGPPQNHLDRNQGARHTGHGNPRSPHNRRRYYDRGSSTASSASTPNVYNNRGNAGSSQSSNDGHKFKVKQSTVQPVMASEETHKVLEADLVVKAPDEKTGPAVENDLGGSQRLDNDAQTLSGVVDIMVASTNNTAANVPAAFTDVSSQQNNVQSDVSSKENQRVLNADLVAKVSVENTVSVSNKNSVNDLDGSQKVDEEISREVVDASVPSDNIANIVEGATATSSESHVPIEQNIQHSIVTPEESEKTVDTVGVVSAAVVESEQAVGEDPLSSSANIASKTVSGSVASEQKIQEQVLSKCASQTVCPALPTINVPTAVSSQADVNTSSSTGTTDEPTAPESGVTSFRDALMRSSTGSKFQQNSILSRSSTQRSNGVGSTQTIPKKSPPSGSLADKKWMKSASLTEKHAQKNLPKKIALSSAPSLPRRPQSKCSSEKKYDEDGFQIVKNGAPASTIVIRNKFSTLVNVSTATDKAEEKIVSENADEVVVDNTDPEPTTTVKIETDKGTSNTVNEKFKKGKVNKKNEKSENKVTNTSQLNAQGTIAEERAVAPNAMNNIDEVAASERTEELEVAESEPEPMTTPETTTANNAGVESSEKSKKKINEMKPGEKTTITSSPNAQATIAEDGSVTTDTAKKGENVVERREEVEDNETDPEPTKVDPKTAEETTDKASDKSRKQKNKYKKSKQNAIAPLNIKIAEKRTTAPGVTETTSEEEEADSDATTHTEQEKIVTALPEDERHANRPLSLENSSEISHRFEGAPIVLGQDESRTITNDRRSATSNAPLTKEDEEKLKVSVENKLDKFKNYVCVKKSDEEPSHWASIPFLNDKRKSTTKERDRRVKAYLKRQFEERNFRQLVPPIAYLIKTVFKTLYIEYCSDMGPYLLELVKLEGAGGDLIHDNEFKIIKILLDRSGNSKDTTITFDDF